MKKIALVLLISMLTVSAVYAIDSSNWENVTVTGNVFKIPPQYTDGIMKETMYTYINWTTFQISDVGESLPTVYVFAEGDNATKEDLNINGHAVRYFNEYNPAANANVSRAFFSCGDSVYMISWQSDNFTDDVKEIIANAEPSNFSSSEFYDILKEAKEQYLEQQEEDLNTPYYYYDYSYDHQDNHHSFLDYYIAYRLLRSL